MIDDLAKQAGIPLDSYETVRVGMNVTAAILRGDIDTGVGFTVRARASNPASVASRRSRRHGVSRPAALVLLLTPRPASPPQNFQRIELEELSAEDAGMLRIDELNDLGCCCFCSVQYVANGDYFEKNPEKITGFMKAMRRATDFTIEHPDVRRRSPHPTPHHTRTRMHARVCFPCHWLNGRVSLRCSGGVEDHDAR